jgi:hypothetical protein
VINDNLFQQSLIVSEGLVSRDPWLFEANQNCADILMLSFDRTGGTIIEHCRQKATMQALVVIKPSELFLEHREVIRDNRFYFDSRPITWQSTLAPGVTPLV